MDPPREAAEGDRKTGVTPEGASASARSLASLSGEPSLSAEGILLCRISEVVGAAPRLLPQRAARRPLQRATMKTGSPTGERGQKTTRSGNTRMQKTLPICHPQPVRVPFMATGLQQIRTGITTRDAVSHLPHQQRLPSRPRLLPGHPVREQRINRHPNRPLNLPDRNMGTLRLSGTPGAGRCPSPTTARPASG